ncbi:MAG: Putrescine-binding periplasmic protein precursor [Firmicutes bacterium ADurb.Bin080]|jgi:spermidine/putrescine transport system substrate-binding protein|nr:ABC transporter substrate-binding protein [Clostridiales bacterium]OQC12724.1 MAG: Putrescine-binding periplasmic protein precursor [Firmicutes bacterium ADurb.Bin080]
MKKIVLATVLLLAMTSVFFSAYSAESITAEAATDEKLYIYNWGDYIGPDVIDNFETWYQAETGRTIDVVYTLYDTNEIMLTNLTKGEEVLDLICPSDYAIEKLMKEGKLQKINKSAISTIGNVHPALYTKVDEVFTDIMVGDSQEDMSDYFVPYMWGTLGIMYNTDVVSREVAEEAGYGLLWNTPEIKALNKKILIKDSIRDTYVAALMYLKETDSLPDAYKTLSVQDLINTVNDDLLAAAEEILIEQKKVLKEYEVDIGKGDMMAGKAYANLAWSGDALWAIEEAYENDVNLDYFVPEVGGNVWFDGWAIPANAQNVTGAHKFIEYVCMPEVAITNSIEIGYTCAVDPAILSSDSDVIALLEDNEYVVDDYFNDSIRYPDITSSLGVMKDFGPSQQNALAMWERVKSASVAGDWVIWVVIGSVALAAGLGILLFFVIKNKKGMKGRAVLVSKTEDEQEEIEEEEDNSESK